MAAVIEIDGLRKEFRRRRGRTVAVDGVSLSVAAGRVHGFLGPNGSGKTTTIRCLLGLVRPTSGRIAVLGHEVPSALPAAAPRVGSIVESPALFPTMTGRENLRLLAAIAGVGHQRVEQALAEVGLAERGGDAVRKYSLGMRQRLGLAAALLKDPELVVLDEPANGLDPAGIREVRVLLRRLAAEGRTVLVSSHILSEVEQTCDAVTILSRGRVVADGPVDSVLAASRQEGLIVKVDALDRGALVLRGAGFGTRREHDHLVVAVDPRRAADVTRALAEAGLWVSELRRPETTLEDLFIELTAAAEPPVAAAVA